MYKLLVIFAVALFLAYLSEQKTKAAKISGRYYKIREDWAYILLVIALSLFSGLRTLFNDTWNYTNAFRSAPTVTEFLSNADNLNPFRNPLFYLLQSILKTITDNPQWLLIVTSVITQCCIVWFIKRYSDHFLFSIFIYFTLGTFVFTLAALKQVLGMAIVTLAFPYLEKKKWTKYYLIIFIAMLIHTYALFFAVLPLFTTRPWRMFTFFFIAGLVAVMLNFEEAITAFIEQANDLGKTLAEFEVFDGATINIFRLAVYAVPPLISFLFQKWVFRDSTKMENVLVHMSIISLAFMCLGTQAGANMFGRMGNYFELGTICYLPTMLKKTFEDRSYRVISIIACIGFMGFFIYANAINIDFGQAYQSISLWDFLRSLWDA